jgi:hypothetical protein
MTDQAAAPSPGLGARWKGLGGALLLLVLLATAAYGGDFLGIRQRLQPAPAPAAPVAHGVTPSSGGTPVLASQPWWQNVTTVQGASTDMPTVTIGQGAIQWRAEWSCSQSGHLAVALPRGSGIAASGPLIDAACPGQGTAYSTRTGAIPLRVTASEPWQLHVEQQVDIPVSDPPLPAMLAPGAAAVSSGSFYDLDRTGHGKATIYRLADRSYAVRLDNFYVTPNSELELRFSSEPAPHSDDAVTQSSVASVAPLPVTAGSLNVPVPSSVDPAKYRSLVVWCLQVQTAYSAATLTASA